MVFRENLEAGVVTDVLAAAVEVPACTRANANHLGVVTPEKLPGDVTGEATVGKANLHDLGETEHVLFARFVEHRAEFRHDDGLVALTVNVGDGLHRLAEVFRIEVVVAGVVVSVTGVVKVVGVAVELSCIEFLGILFKVAVADTERFRANQLGLSLHGVIDGVQGFLVTGDFVSFCRFEESFFVIGFHVRFVLERNIVRRDACGLVGFEALLPPVGKITVDVFAIRVAVRGLERVLALDLLSVHFTVQVAARLELCRSRPAGHLDFHVVAEAGLGGLDDVDVVLDFCDVFVLVPVTHAEQRNVKTRECGVEKGFLVCCGEVLDPALVVNACATETRNFLGCCARIDRNACGIGASCEQCRRNQIFFHITLLNYTGYIPTPVRPYTES